MISLEQEAEILRLFHAEKWLVGTIARELSIHHSTVRRVLSRGTVAVAHVSRASILDPYLPFIHETLSKYPTLPSSRLFEMLRGRGYKGRSRHLRQRVAELRPRKPAEAYLRLRTLPGEQAQVDWGHFGKLTIGRAVRSLMAFVMVLSYSRRTFLRFYLDAQMPNFVRGHVDAFAHFGGVARVLLYDNLKSAVLERNGTAIRFHPKLLELCKHYRFEPRPVAKARGNEKGRVERRIRHIRTSFMPARVYRDVDDLNTQALEWCAGVAAERACPEDSSRTIRDVFEAEKPQLLLLPDNPFDTTERVEVTAGKQPYVRFDLNDYSIPHDRTRRPLTVLADLSTVRVTEGLDVIATHPRSFDKGQQVEDPAHIDALRNFKTHAKARSVLDRLHRAAPTVVRLLERAAERGASLARMTTQLNALLDAYGPAKLERAIAEAIEHETPHVGAIRQLLDLHRQERGQPPPLAVASNWDPRTRDLVVQTHDLKNYDHLTEDDDDETITPQP